MIVTGLKQQSQGVNKIISGSCFGTRTDLTIKLSPGEANRTITSITLTDGTGCLSTIYQVDYQAWASPLTVPFVLTQFNSLNVTLSIDPCGAPASTGTYQLSVVTSGPAVTYDYYFDVEFIDRSTVINTLIPNTSAYLIECLNQPNNTQTKFFTFTNPTDIPVRFDFTPSLSGLYWEANGVQVGSYFFVPANGTTTLSWANNWNVTPANFTVDFYVACILPLITLNVTWASVVCGDCGLNCSGLSIGTPAPGGGVVDLTYDGTFSNSSNWLVTSSTGSGHTFTVNNLELVCVNDPVYGDVWTISNTTFYNGWTFPPNTAVQIDVIIEIKTGASFGVSPNYLAFYGGWYGASPAQTVNMVPNQSYSFAFNNVTFQYPGVGGPDYGIYFFVSGATPGTILQIEEIVIKYVPNVAIATVDLDCSTLDPYNYSAIGDSKEVIYDLYYMNGWQNNAQFYFNPWLFSDTGDWSIFSGANGYDQPTSGYSIVANQNWIGDGLWHDMSLFGVNNSVGSQQNWSCKVQFVDSNAFKVKFAFFVTMDVLEYVRNIVLPNQRRLLSGNKNDLPYTSVLPSVYTGDKLLSVYFYIIDPNVQVNNAPYECYFTRDVYFTARFLNSGLYGGPSEMTNPTTTLTRNAATVTDLSPLTPTEVQFEIDYTNPIDTVVAWVIATNTANNTSNFYYNYDASRATIITQVSGVLNKDIEGPSQGPTNIGGNTYQIKFNVGTGINPAFTYRILFVCYSSTDSMVNTFISDSLAVSQTPDVNDVCCDLTVFSSWNTLQNTFSGHCYAGTVKARTKHNLSIQAGNFETCLQTLGKSPSDSWLNYLDQVTLRVYKRLDNTLGQSEHLFFYYDQQTFTKNHVTQLWTGAAGQRLSVSDNGTNLNISYSPITILGDMTPFSASSQNVAMAYSSQPFNRSAVSFNTAQNYVTNNNVLTSWGNEPIYLEYELKFRLRFLAIPCTVNLYQINMIYANDYEPNPLPSGTNILDALEIYGVDSSATETLITGQFCKQDYEYLKAKVITTNPVTYASGMLIAYIENVGVPNQFANQGEEESFQVFYIGALSNTTLYDVDQNFVSGEAYFKIDISNLTNGTYKLCAIRTEY